MRRLIPAVLACLAAGEADAGAWTLPDGAGQVIMTTGRKMAPVGAFAGEIADSDSNYSHLFAEFGLLDRLTLGLTAYGEFSSTDPEELEVRVGGHLRGRVWQGQSGEIVSVQAGASGPIERWVVGRLSESLPDSVPEAELRVLYGRGWQTGWGDSFVSAESGFRWRGEKAADEIRLEVTGGYRPWKPLAGMLGVYGAMPLGGGGASLKLAPSVAYTLWPWLGDNDKKPYGPLHPNTVQLGLVWDALDPGDGLGVQISIWRRF